MTAPQLVLLLDTYQGVFTDNSQGNLTTAIEFLYNENLITSHGLSYGNSGTVSDIAITEKGKKLCKKLLKIASGIPVKATLKL